MINIDYEAFVIIKTRFLSHKTRFLRHKYLY